MYRKTGIAPLRRHLDEGMLGPTLPYEKVQTRIFSEDEVRRAPPPRPEVYQLEYAGTINRQTAGGNPPDNGAEAGSLPPIEIAANNA